MRALDTGAKLVFADGLQLYRTGCVAIRRLVGRTVHAGWPLMQMCARRGCDGMGMGWDLACSHAEGWMGKETCAFDWEGA